MARRLGAGASPLARGIRQALCCAALLGLAACAAAPAEQFRTYANAADALNRTTLVLLDDYQKAMAEEPAAESPTAVPASFDPDGVDGGTVPGVAERRAAMAAIADYNEKMLFLAEGGSYRAVQARVGSLLGLLGSAIPGLAGANGLLGSLAGRLEQARSAAEFRDALRAATVPPPEGQSCAAGPAPAAAASEGLRDSQALAACQPIIDGLYALMRADTATYYKAQLGRYARSLTALSEAHRAAARPIFQYAAGFRRPTDGAMLERLAVLENTINGVGKTLTPDYVAVPLGANGVGAVMDDAVLSTIALRVDSLSALADRHAALTAAMRRYHAGLAAYVRQIERARAYLRAVEEAAVRPVDNLARAEEIIRLALQVESGGVGAREAFEAASRILLAAGGT